MSPKVFFAIEGFGCDVAKIRNLGSGLFSIYLPYSSLEGPPSRKILKAIYKKSAPKIKILLDGGSFDRIFGKVERDGKYHPFYLFESKFGTHRGSVSSVNGDEAILEMQGHKIIVYRQDNDKENCILMPEFMKLSVGATLA